MSKRKGDKGFTRSSSIYLFMILSPPFGLLLRRFVFRFSPFVLAQAHAFAPRFEFLFSSPGRFRAGQTPSGNWRYDGG